MERVALGYLRLSYEEYARLTPREMQLRLEAESDRESRQLERLAQLACWVINPWLGRGQKVTPAKLLKRQRRSF